MKIDIATMIVGLLIGGAFQSLLTVVAIRVDIRWIKRAIAKIEKRVDLVEREVFQQ